MKKVILLLFTCFLSCISGAEYKKKEKISVSVNTVGPFHNPAESYKYYSLPFCAPKETYKDDSNFGGDLSGDRKQNSLYDLYFKEDVAIKTICSFRLSKDEVNKFYDAISSLYIFEIFVDDLPVKGFIGEVEEWALPSGPKKETHIYLFTHLDFSVAYHGSNIIACNLTTDPHQRIELIPDQPVAVQFSYSARWKYTNTIFENRMALHSKSVIGDQAIEVHWLSIINSFVLVILLTAFLSLILMRVLKKDFARYMAIDDDDLEENAEDSGWKLVHGDVFRFPEHRIIFSAAIGTGIQILVLVISILLLALGRNFYPGNRGAVYTAAIVIYALTAGIAGYVSTSLYVSLGGKKWATNAVVTACFFAVPFFMVFLFINTVAVMHTSSSALPFRTILIVVLLWSLVTFPLTIIGSMRGKYTEPFVAPCKTNRAPRKIPPVYWYRTTLIQMFIAGFLPFSAIYIELHYIFASVWGHRAYTLFGILSLAFTMLIIVTAFITVALTYFQLAAEDYRWWWKSFFSGASTGLFMYIYAIFYYNYRSEMTGVLQGSFFFGYMFIVAYAFALMLGAVGFFMAKRFVIHIYSSIKID